MKREHDMEAKLLIFKLIYNLTLIYGNGLWVSNRENEIQAKEMSFSTGCLGSQTHRLVQLLLHIGHLIKMPPVFASVVWGFRHVILKGGPAETWEKPW